MELSSEILNSSSVFIFLYSLNLGFSSFFFFSLLFLFSLSSSLYLVRQIAIFCYSIDRLGRFTKPGVLWEQHKQRCVAVELSSEFFFCYHLSLSTKLGFSLFSSFPLQTFGISVSFVFQIARFCSSIDRAIGRVSGVSIIG